MNKDIAGLIVEQVNDFKTLRSLALTNKVFLPHCQKRLDELKKRIASATPTIRADQTKSYVYSLFCFCYVALKEFVSEEDLNEISEIIGVYKDYNVDVRAEYKPTSFNQAVVKLFENSIVDIEYFCSILRKSQQLVEELNKMGAF